MNTPTRNAGSMGKSVASVLTQAPRLRAPALGMVVATACLLALPSHAQERASRQENIGVLTGLAVGAAAGGPVGAIIGSAAGAWLGERYHRQVVRQEELARSLDESEAHRAELMRTVATLHSSLSREQARNQELGHALERARALQADIGFRTGDAQLSPETRERLERLGELVAALPGMMVRVEGHADPRGPEEMNAELSQRRAQAVASVLAEAGVPADRLIVEAYGESKSTSPEGDLDAYAFDRRVTVTLEDMTGGTVARAD